MDFSEIKEARNRRLDTENYQVSLPVEKDMKKWTIRH